MAEGRGGGGSFSFLRSAHAVDLCLCLRRQFFRARWMVGAGGDDDGYTIPLLHPLYTRRLYIHSPNRCAGVCTTNPLDRNSSLLRFEIQGLAWGRETRPPRLLPHQDMLLIRTNKQALADAELCGLGDMGRVVVGCWVVGLPC